MKTLYIIRGMPGTGKSTLAHKLTDTVFEADQYFETPSGYVFEPVKLPDAHAQCQFGVHGAMERGVEVIAVSNTFSQKWEYAPYLLFARSHGYRVVELTMTGSSYGSVHNVPEETLQKMRNRWEI